MVTSDHKIYPADSPLLAAVKMRGRSGYDNDAGSVAKDTPTSGHGVQFREANRPCLAPASLRNHLLNALPDDERQHLQRLMQPTRLVHEQVLHEIGNAMDTVYFLESGLVSLIADTGDGGSVEIGMTGREGFVGATMLLNRNPVSTHRAVVRMPGAAMQLRGSDFHAAIARLPVLHDRCLRYLETLIAQTAQTAACNARHELRPRLARLLLMYSDRVDSNDLPITQEFLSFTLGVRRAGVSVVAGALQMKRVIGQSRGKLTILDRGMLEEESCHCYQLTENNHRQITGDTA